MGLGEREAVWDICLLTSLSLFSFDSFGFIVYSLVLDKESLDLKVLAKK